MRIPGYRILAVLGKGSQGRVLRAESEADGRLVAIKAMDQWAQGTQPAEVRARALREVEALRGVHHPALVELLAADLEGDLPYLVTTLVEGQDLSERLAGGPLTAQEARSVLTRVAGALAALHAVGVVHRDVKPGNVFLDAEGLAYLGDLGLCRAVDSRTLTGTGLVVGSLAYLAPELYQGAPQGPPADVFALGITVLEALHGTRPAVGEQGVVMPAAGPAPGAPRAFQELVRAMLRVDPERRPSAAEVAQRAGAAGAEDGALDATETGTMVRPRSVPLPSTGPHPREATAPSGASKPSSSSGRGLLLGAMATFALVGFLGFPTASRAPENPPSAPPSSAAPERSLVQELAADATPFLLPHEQENTGVLFLRAGLADPRAPLRWRRYLSRLEAWLGQQGDDPGQTSEARIFWEGRLLQGLVETLDGAARLRRQSGSSAMPLQSPPVPQALEARGMSSEQGAARAQDFLDTTRGFLESLSEEVRSSLSGKLLTAAWERPMLDRARSEPYRVLVDELMPGTVHSPLRGAVLLEVAGYLRDTRAHWVAPCARRQEDARRLLGALAQPGEDVAPQTLAQIAGYLRTMDRGDGCGRPDDPPARAAWARLAERVR